MAENETQALRIYIGGLGATVTATDLTKTFSAPNLGTVTDVEVIRTKQRSFAYLDFLPCSDKGLAKLFSTYNGCKWKGGSLRLEKAKEHYLQQMRREWEEDTELASNLIKEDDDASENVLHAVKSKKLPDLDKMQLKIFFPRFGKVKALPFKGTGKHKYSFQRVEALTLPKYFCDCEEHSGVQDVDEGHQCHDDTKVKHDSYDENENENENKTDNGEIDEQELTMMNSVMSKLFEREVFSEASRKCGPSAVTFKKVNASSDLPSAEEHLDQMSDEDNLIINIVGGSKTNATSNHDLCLKELRNSNSRPQNFQISKQKMIAPVGQKRKQLKDDKTAHVAGRKIRKILPSDKDENTNLSHSKGIQASDISVSKKCPDGHENSDEPQTNVSETIHRKPSQLQKPARSVASTEVDNSAKGISSSAPIATPGIDFQSGSDILSKPQTAEKDENNNSLQIKEAKVSAEVLPDSGKMIAERAGRGTSWLQKSSWTQLVAGSESSSFSISHILPQINFDKQEIQQPTVIDFSSPKQTADVPVSQELPETVLLAAQENLGGNTFSNQVDGQTSEVCTSSASNMQPLAAKKAAPDADKPFVRTAASMKEYAKLRASFKKKVDKK